MQHRPRRHPGAGRSGLALAAAVLAVPLALGQAGPAAAQPFSFETASGRLPKTVVPLDYQITIAPDAAAKILNGRERITLEFRAATDRIQFNSLNQLLSEVKLDGRPVKTVVSDDDQQLTTLTLPEIANAGPHILTFAYHGVIETAPRGLFVQPYHRPAGGDDVLLSTQFEQTDARRMFPCWDEPAFRARFQLTARVPAGWAAISNMPVNRRVHQGAEDEVSFAPSPSMPTYLLEFTAGDLAAIEATSGGTRFAVWAVRGQQQDGAAALANAQQILADYNDYFGVAYPLPKLDSIAVPGGFQGAMENWGAITYNDQTLLLTASSTLANRQTVFSIEAHEMAHQWNGDLVTMGWWDDIWLNESFASWMAAKETDRRNPRWAWLESEDDDKELAMTADARVSSHAIQQHVSDELQAANAFDPEITYAKGEAVLRMFEAYLGADRFQDGIRRFITAHAYGNATSADLWQALSAASGSDVSAIAADWTTHPGFPLVSVAARCDSAGGRRITLAQRRFLLQGSDPTAARWAVPLQIRIGAAGQPQAVLLRQDGQSLEAGRCDEPLSVNADAVGFYRTAYDDATLQTDTVAFASLPARDRIALLDDQWALVQAGQQSLARYLSLASAMGEDLDQRAWEQVADALANIERVERGSPGHAAFTAYARGLLQPVAARLGWQSSPDETPGLQQLRRRVLSNLGAWGDDGVIAEARRRFGRFLADRASLGPDDQSAILSVVARNADADDFARLHALAQSAGNETELRRYYSALMQVRAPALAAQAGAIALSPEIPAQAEALRLQLVIGLHDENPTLSWSLFAGNIDRLMAPEASFAPLIIAQYSPDIFWNAVPIDALQAWVTAHVPAEMSDNVARGMESARFKVAQKQALTAATDRYVASLDKSGAGR